LENYKDVGPTPGPSITIFYTLNGLSKGQIYHIAVTAYDIDGNQSDPEACHLDNVEVK
jgi:hypothetical protein